MDIALGWTFISFEIDSEVRHISDLTGRQVEAWEVAYFNGAAILDEIPVANRDQTDQIAFRDGGESGCRIQNAPRQVSWKVQAS